MYQALTVDEAYAHCLKRQALVDQWVQRGVQVLRLNEPNVVEDQERYAVAYWFWHNDKRHRIHKVGRSLPDAVARCLGVEYEIKNLPKA